MVMVKTVRDMAAQFDVLHFHTDNLHFPVFSGVLAARTVTTLHSRQVARPRCALRSIPANAARLNFSAQREAVPHALRRHHPARPARHLLPLTAQPSGGYLAFLGRISREKRLDRAIAIARAAGLPLKMAAKVGRADDDYFRTNVAPLLTQPGWSSSAKSTSGKRPGSWVTPGDSCFPLIGRNHSDWS
jgi:hypothetical protein